MAAVSAWADPVLALVAVQDSRMVHFADNLVSGIFGILEGSEPFGGVLPGGVLPGGILPGIVGIGRWILVGTGVATRRKAANRMPARPRMASRRQ
jgi:hypothetical protein